MFGSIIMGVYVKISKVVFSRVRTKHTRGIYPGITLQRTSVSSVGHSYSYPELVEVLYGSHIRTRNFWKICTPVPQIPGVRVYHFYNLCESCTPVPQYPELLCILYHFRAVPGISVSSVRSPYTLTRDFCDFCKTVAQYPGYGYTFVTIPGEPTCMNSGVKPKKCIMHFSMMSYLASDTNRTPKVQL